MSDEGTIHRLLTLDIWECHGCGFRMDAGHEDDTKEGGYTCPLCEETRLHKQLKQLNGWGS